MTRSFPKLVLVLLAGCASEPALDLELVPDPNINSESQIVERIESVVYVFDSADGLYAPGEESSHDGVQVTNADADASDLELVVSVPVVDHLPFVRLERGTLPDVPLDVRVIGESGVGTIAEGRALAARFGIDSDPLRVPFNIRPGQLPPRVGEVIPADGQTAQGCVVPTVVVMFSKPIEPSTLFAEGAVSFQPGGRPAAIRLDATGVVAQNRPSAPRQRRRHAVLPPSHRIQRHRRRRHGPRSGRRRSREPAVRRRLHPPMWAAPLDPNRPLRLGRHGPDDPDLPWHAAADVRRRRVRPFELRCRDLRQRPDLRSRHRLLHPRLSALRRRERLPDGTADVRRRERRLRALKGQSESRI